MLNCPNSDYRHLMASRSVFPSRMQLGLVLFHLVFALGGKGLAADRIREPIRWHSQGMIVAKDENLIRLLQKVEITQRDTTIVADMAEVYLDFKTKVVKKIFLQGGVKISFAPGTGEGKVTAESNTAVFLPAESITLTGTVRLERNGNIIRGTEIVYDIRAGWMRVKEAEGILRSNSDL